MEELPGALAQEKTLDEARISLKEAIRDVIEANRETARQEAIGGNAVREELRDRMRPSKTVIRGSSCG